jgi:hypothetical protein
MPTSTEIEQFLLALKDNLVAIFGRAVSVVLTLAGFYLENAMLKRITWIAAGFSFVVALFSMWLNEHRKAVKAENPLGLEIEAEVAIKMESLNETEWKVLRRLATPVPLNDLGNMIANLGFKTSFLVKNNDGLYEINSAYLKSIQLWFASHPTETEGFFTSHR